LWPPTYDTPSSVKLTGKKLNYVLWFWILLRFLKFFWKSLINLGVSSLVPVMCTCWGNEFPRSMWVLLVNPMRIGSGGGLYTSGNSSWKFLILRQAKLIIRGRVSWRVGNKDVPPDRSTTQVPIARMAMNTTILLHLPFVWIHHPSPFFHGHRTLVDLDLGKV